MLLPPQFVHFPKLQLSSMNWNECGFGSCFSDKEYRNELIILHPWINSYRQNVERSTCVKLELPGEANLDARETRVYGAERELEVLERL